MSVARVDDYFFEDDSEDLSYSDLDSFPGEFSVLFIVFLFLFFDNSENC